MRAERSTSSESDFLPVRPYAIADQDAVLDLVEADRLAGQPPVTPEMLAEALAGRSTVDAGWWQELDSPRTAVVTGKEGTAIGVVSYATRPRDNAGLILWLHAREEPAVIDALIDHALAEMGSRARHDSFDFASALSLGLEGLPVGHRAATHAALVARGFTGRNLWRYMRSEVTTTGSPDVHKPDQKATVLRCDDPVGWRLEIRTSEGALAAEATVGEPARGIGVLWWIGVEPQHRGRGLSRPLLDQAITVLAQHGAREIILFVDDDEPPGGDRDRTAANHLYDSAGFVEVDRLYSYQCQR